MSKLNYDDKVLKKIDFKGALIPAVVQDVKNNQILMLAYMNQESLRRTMESGTTWFWSRSRKEYWNKGATSGHFQYVESIELDCDYDTILLKVHQIGAACHTGNRSCFFNKLASK